MLSFVFLQGHWQFTNTLFFSGVQKKKKKKISNAKELNHGNVGKRRKRKKKDKCFHFWKKKVQHNTSQNEDLLCYFQNSGIERCCLVLFNLLCSVLRLISWTIWSLYVLCWLYIFFLYIKTTKKRKEKKRHNCSLSCTHTKKWILSQEGQGSRVPTPRHFNVHFYDEFKKKKKKKKDDLKETILSTESYGFQKKRKYLLFLNP